MPKIYIEYDNVRTNNYLQDAIRYLKIADDIYLNTPNGFSRYNEVNRLKSTLKSVNTDLERLLDWLETSQKKL